MIAGEWKQSKTKRDAHLSWAVISGNQGRRRRKVRYNSNTLVYEIFAEGRKGRMMIGKRLFIGRGTREQAINSALLPAAYL